jgi:hypothetical protein
VIFKGARDSRPENEQVTCHGLAASIQTIWRSNTCGKEIAYTETLETITEPRVPRIPITATDKSSGLGKQEQELVALAQQILNGTALFSSHPSEFVTAKDARSSFLPKLDLHRLDTLRDNSFLSSPSESPEQPSNMTTAEAQLTPISFDTPPAESATSRFTAVNGATGPAPSSSNGSGHRRRDSEDRPQGQPRTTPSGQEKLTITTTTTQREDWQHPGKGDRQQPNMAGPQYQQQSNYSETESSHKRKRSGSIDRQTTQPSSTSSYHSHGLPSKPPDSGLGDSPDTPREASIRPRPYHAVRDPYVDDSQAHYPQYNEEARENGSGGNLWYSHQTPDGRPPADNQSMAHQISPEDQLREALQRDAQGVDSQGAYTGTSPGDEEDRSGSYQGGYAPERMPLQMNPDHKKRKRNFSNRTKTGCMTCRRRKKKCDETRPECKNPPLALSFADISLLPRGRSYLRHITVPLGFDYLTVSRSLRSCGNPPWLNST